MTRRAATRGSCRHSWAPVNRFRLPVRCSWQGSGSGQWMAPRFLIQRLWCHVKTVRPDDGPCLRIDSYLGEVAGVTQGLKDAGPLLRREVDVTNRPVIEEQAQSIVTDHGHADNSRQIRHHLHLMGEARSEPAVRIAGLAPNWPTAHPCAGLPI